MVLSGGGTGGHVYPGLAVGRALQRRARNPVELLYIGVKGRVDERIVPAEGVPFKAVAGGQVRVGPVGGLIGLARLALGSLQALVMLRRERPDAVFATGGYASVPVGVAARLLRLPLVVFLPDVRPGWAVRLLARLASRMATASEAALAFLPREKTHVVGYPVRDEFWSVERDEARRRLGLPQDERVLLVYGGSLGAHAINEAVFAQLPRLVERCVVLHVTGQADGALAARARERLPERLRERYRPVAYLRELPAAMKAADLAVTRAGAAVLGELPAAGLPAILVPGVFEGHDQTPNAEYLASKGAAVVLPQTRLGELADQALALLDDREKLAAMAANARALARPDAADALADLLLEVAA
ncbi:MAG TPA: undecaprenyldiphospho-muramoylpentapeptide beta-N-acetylglucosaminyltransferase [Dehalococcoidia bacterium]|nr:undecaprenyldiphospho-muramoylpentapeptide beta-N-acetylglucosaminyltransferase [Dehalococcoidia bacterium]